MFYYYDLKLDIDVESKPEKVKEFLRDELGAIFAIQVRTLIYSICTEYEVNNLLCKEYDFIKNVTLVHSSDFITQMTELPRGKF